VFRSVVVGSATRAWKRRAYADRSSAGWACEKMRARSVGRSSIGNEGFTGEAGASEDILTGQ